MVDRQRAARRVVQGVALAAAGALALSACGTPDSGNDGPGAAKRGGTINVLMQSDFEHIDPQRTYTAAGESFVRLLAPALTAYKNAKGKEGTEIVGDAATDTGTHNADNTEWSFTLRDGLKWQDGKDVTCQDFKYGVERSFSDVITDGADYPKQYLVGGDTYKGIYLQKEGLPSIVCAGNKITFKLRRSISDFNYTVTLPTFSAVRADKDTHEKYDSNVFSYGPYQIDSYVRGKSIQLSRNKYYDQSKDQVRKNLPDKWNITQGPDENVITDRLIQDKAADQNTISLGANISPAQSAQVQNDPKLRKRLLSGPDGFTYYLSINTTKIKDLKCRQAYTYAINKASYLTALGGPAVGDLATSIIAPNNAAHRDDIDVYGLKDKPEGDVAKAKQLLAQSPTCPHNITFDYRTGNKADDNAAAAIVAGMARAGITVKLNPIPRSTYIATVGKPAAQHDMAINSWIADWASGSSVIPQLFDGRIISPSGNSNRSQINDPAINAGIDAAYKETDNAKAQKLWGDLDEKVQQTAAVIPLRYTKAYVLYGSKITGAFLDPVYSDVDLNNVGVS
ncbi:ABC transporter substrate-binding protein [Fodinicola acaciae]|uniref:ABC transporter substrate-binding protein n=1 Tax=Fodinicola acaciae TaxID=2681555 RepID=UPI0013D8A997|nr:ABC transporter substrate-binding protein [Fodinicola acaciae]